MGAFAQIYENQKVRVIVLSLVIVAIGVYGWTVYSRHTRGLERPQAQSRPFAPPAPEEREARREEMINSLGLTEEQRKKVEALHEGEPGPEMFKAMQDVLTPEQQAQMMERRSARMQQKLNDAAKSMRPEDVAALKERMESKMREGGGAGLGPRH